MMTPPPLQLTGGNWFHQGWIDGILGLSPREFPGAIEVDLIAYRDGHQMAMETECRLSLLRVAVREAVREKQLIVN